MKTGDDASLRVCASSTDSGSGYVSPGVLPVVPPGTSPPVIPDKDHRSNAATAASAAGVRALSAQALQFYFRAPVKAFFRTRVDYLAYARGPEGGLGGVSGLSTLSSRLSGLSGLSGGSLSSSLGQSRLPWVRSVLARSTPGVLAAAIRRDGWSVVPNQVMPPLLANVSVAAVLYTSYLHILGHFHPESAQARRRVYPPPAPAQTFAAGFLAGSLQSLVAAPLDAIQARYDHGAASSSTSLSGGGKASARPLSMWTFSAAKLREIGLRGIFAGWGLSFLKDSFGNAIFFSVFEYVKAQSYYGFVTRYYGAMDDPIILARQGAGTVDKDRPTPSPSLPLVIRPHYALEPLFLLLAGISASFSQQLLLHPLTHIQVVHWDLLEDIDDAAKKGTHAVAPVSAAEALAGKTPTAAPAACAVSSPHRPHFRIIMRIYYRAYQEAWSRCMASATAEGRSAVAWLYRGFWWNAIRQVPSTSAGLIIFELARRKYGLAGDEVRISSEGYDILLS